MKPDAVKLAPLLIALALLLPGASTAHEAPFAATARLVVARHGADLLRLARQTLVTVVDRGVIDPPIPVPPQDQHPAPMGVFVTLVRNGTVRGCFGSMDPQGKTLEALVVEAALGAARFDPRSKPVRQAELSELQVILSLVGPTVPVLSIAEVDAKHQGLMVRAGEKRSVLLPGEAKTASWSLRRNLRQAGIRRREHYEMFRFHTVTL